MSKEELTYLFTDWKARYDENPEGFQDCPAFAADPPESYGEGAAVYFLWLIAMRDQAIDEGVFV